MSRDYMTIGEVVQRLQGAYPDLSISKVRFLEEEGLISPERTAGGYRKFHQSDVTRVEMVLRLQKDHFLPLAIIRDKLAEFDRGRVPVELEREAATSTQSLPLSAEDSGPLPVEDAPAALGIPVSFIRELAEFGLVGLDQDASGATIDRSDIAIIHAAWDLRRFGVEPRHLRMYEVFAEREAALFSQILMPAFRHKTADSKQRLTETLTDISRLTDDLKSRLLRRSVRRAFDDLG